MRTPRALELLDTWEAVSGSNPLAQAVALLRLVDETETPEGLPIGARDAALFGLRQELFGRMIDATATCPGCGETLQVAFTADDVVSGEGASERTVTSPDGRRLTLRPVTSADLAAVVGQPMSAARSRLAERCAGVDIGELDSAAVDIVVEALADLDPDADLLFDLGCEACAHRWPAVFDIGSYLWSELGRWIQRLLLDVHVLAATYGWTEEQVLALTPWRRQAYVEMASR